LHGLGDASVTWHKVEQRLRDAGFRVTAWDALGAGASDHRANADYGLAAHVARLIAVCDALDIERVYLIGNSLGGSLALLTAQTHPERTRSLVLVNPAAYPEGGTTPAWLWAIPALVESVLRRIGPAGIAHFALRLHYGDHARITADDLRAYTELAARDGAIGGLILQQRQLLPAPEVIAAWRAGFASIDAPALILWVSELLA
jgi:pimeloyl-ACP methyl ester carboxylesterase